MVEDSGKLGMVVKNHSTDKLRTTKTLKRLTWVKYMLLSLNQLAISVTDFVIIGPTCTCVYVEYSVPFETSGVLL